jgi:uncharacterized protein (UPF0333 family)
MKAQVSVEYLVIIAIALVILVPLIVYSNTMITNYNEENKIALAKNAVKKLGESADWVYSQGMPARLETEIYFPQGITSNSLINNTIMLKIKTVSGISDIYYNTISPLNGTIPKDSGYYSISFVAFQNYVNISW